MPSLNFEEEKTRFRERYESSHRLMEGAVNSFMALISALLRNESKVSISKIEGRVKDREECIRKFNMKYRTDLEGRGQDYEIWGCISDLVGIRVVCLYEDDVERIRSVLSEHFDVIDVTDKISQIENTEGSFGYKGLHLDLKMGGRRRRMPEYVSYDGLGFEVQIRTIVQDSWSVLDHKIKYKKSIPNQLKRRINTLAALFELADREFKEIRDATEAEIRKAEELPVLEDAAAAEPEEQPESKARRPTPLDAFSLLRIAQHFFRGYEFEPHKVDGFTEEIVSLQPRLTRGKFNFYLRENIAKVKRYQQEFERDNTSDKLNPFTVMRHSLYLGDKQAFSAVLTNVARESFEGWLERVDADI